MLKVPVPRRGTTVVSGDAPPHELATIGRAGDSTGPQAKLFRYWTTGEGGRVKIRWGTDGSFARCVHHLERHVPPTYSVKGLCANLHKRATGEWPTEHGKAGIPS